MLYKFKGTIELVWPEEIIGGQYSKRDFLVKEIGWNSEYDNFISFPLRNDKINLVTEDNIGSEVDITFRINARKWKNWEQRYYNNLGVVGVKVKEWSNPEDWDVDDDLPF